MRGRDNDDRYEPVAEERVIEHDIAESLLVRFGDQTFSRRQGIGDCGNTVKVRDGVFVDLHQRSMIRRHSHSHGDGDIALHDR